MKMLAALQLRVLIVALLGSASLQLHAQTAPALGDLKTTEELKQTIRTLDAEVFEAYNSCNLKKFSSLFTEDVEFYHDEGGVTLGRDKLTEGVKQNICGKVHRELIADSLEIYPMKHYGAVEIGRHRFTHTGTQDHGVVGEAKFVHLWRYEGGAWKITRVISFDHGAMK